MTDEKDEESKDYEKEYILQKHNNVHNAFIGIYLSLLLGLIAIFFQIPFKEGTSDALLWLIARDNLISGSSIAVLFMLLIMSITTYLINKIAEYETSLRKKKDKRKIIINETGKML